VLQDNHVFFHNVKIPLFSQTLRNIWYQFNVFRLLCTERNQNLLDLFFWACRCYFWGKLWDLPYGNFLYAIDRESHNIQLPLLVELGRLRRSTSVRVSLFAINHDVEQVDGFPFLGLTFFNVFLVEVYTDTESPVVLTVLHMNNSSNVHIRQNILRCSAEVFYFSLVLAGPLF